MPVGTAVTAVLAVAGVAILLAIFALGKEISLWTLSLMNHAGVPFRFLLRMKLTGRDARPVVIGAVKSRMAGLKISYQDLERHGAAGGNVERVVDSLIAAKGAAVSLNFEEAAGMDLTGSDPLAWAQERVRHEGPRESPSSVRWLMERQEAGLGASRGGAVNPIRLLAGLVMAPVAIHSAKRMATRAGLPVEAGEILAIGLKGVDPRLVVEAAIRLRDAGIEYELETLHILPRIGADLRQITASLVAAKSEGLALDFDSAVAMHMGGEDPTRLVEAMRIARAGGWDLEGKDAAEMVFAGHDPVAFVQGELARTPVPQEQ
jgi:uncharacterized protein YqfA (UPF0365 family)